MARWVINPQLLYNNKFEKPAGVKSGRFFFARSTTVDDQVAKDPL